MTSTSSSASSDESEGHRKHHKHSSKHKKKEKSHKKTKKRYRHRSDDDEKGYKKFKRKKEKKVKRSRDESGSDLSDATPIQPNIQPNVERSSDNLHNELPQEAESSYGPALPPHMLQNVSSSKSTDNEAHVAPTTTSSSMIGPTLPAHLMQERHNSDEDNLNVDAIDGNTASESADDDHDALDIVGPLPGKSNPELEQRALEIKLGLVSSGSNNTEEKQKTREEWMMELPKVKGVTDLGLTARQFRTKERPDFSDRSEWTDTPADKEKKKQGIPTEADKKRDKELEEERRKINERDADQARIAKEHKKKHKRDKSLLEIHEKKLKKAKKEKSDEPQVRRPFDRNVDLGANRFDEAQKKSIIKKAQLLDSRFSSGASKYL